MLAVPTGLEPATSGLTGRRELQTSPRDQWRYVRTPNGIRTRAATLKGWCPRPLDDGGKKPHPVESTETLAAAPGASTGRSGAGRGRRTAPARPSRAPTTGSRRAGTRGRRRARRGGSTSSSSVTSSTVPSTRRTLLTACMNASISASSSVTLRPERPSTASTASIARQPAGDQLVAHQPLVLGLAVGVVGVDDGEQPGRPTCPVATGLGEQQPAARRAGGRPAPARRAPRCSDVPGATGDRADDPRLTHRAPSWPTGRARGAGTRASRPAPGCRWRRRPCPCGARRASAPSPSRGSSRTASGART